MDELVIDGAHGEGGGQIVRTAVALAAVSGRKIRIENIRAGRKYPGLAAQHLTSVRAAAAVCQASIQGDVFGSRTLEFAPGSRPLAWRYAFDVSEARKGGSAGSVSLVLQTILLPLIFAQGRSTVAVRGGTHVSASPPSQGIRDAYLPLLRKMGAHVSLELVRWGWYPIGGGEIRAEIDGRGSGEPGPLSPLEAVERGRLLGVQGWAATSNLPDHISRRMADRAWTLLDDAGVSSDIKPLSVEAVCPGAGVFLTAIFENAPAGFSALGRRGLPAEKVAEEAVAEFLAHLRSGASLEPHLADQMILPAVLASGASRFSVRERSRHFDTVAWLVERFGLARLRSEPNVDGRGVHVTIEPMVITVAG